MIRRKSDTGRAPDACSYAEQVSHEQLNQEQHDTRRNNDPAHGQGYTCWCCCPDCTDLSWYYTPRKGVWWQRTPNGGLRLMRETSAESPGSPVQKPSS